MNALLIALIGLPLLTELMGINTSVAQGISLANALVYLAAIGLALRYSITRDFKFEMAGVLACFALMILYAIASILVADFVVDYPRYKALRTLGPLKNRLVDYAVYFAVFLYGVRSAKDANQVLKGLLVCVTVGNIASILHGYGIVDFGFRTQMTNNRLQGFVGEHNQYAAFLALFLPGLVSQGLNTYRRSEKLFWYGSAALAMGALLATASRGGAVAMLFGLAAGCFLFRNQISFGQIAKWVVGGAVSLTVVVIIMSIRYGPLLYQRFVAKSSAVDEGELSSGRTEFWAQIFKVMLEYPITLLTGYGWEVYNTFSFRNVAHNDYLTIWFDIGIIGVILFVAILLQVIRVTTQAGQVAAQPYQSHLMAFVCGFIALCSAIFFVNLYNPWPYVWAYAGLLTRMALETQRATVKQPAQAARVPDRTSAPTAAPLDAYGWLARRKP